MKKLGETDKWGICAIALMMTCSVLVVVGTLSALDSWTAWPPVASCNAESIESCKEGREWLSAGGALLVVLGGLFQYRKSQLWKRAEFVASEMKEFFSDSVVRAATTMIDWELRRINLFQTLDTDQTKWPEVSREMQCRALLPHTIIADRAGGEQATATSIVSDGGSSFTLEEAAIRDSFDRLLDGLERFASYISTGLVSGADLEPYLGYWIRDIASDGRNEIERRWTYLLFVYIEFYDFTGVQRLFRLYGSDIAYGSARFDEVMKSHGQPELSVRLIRELELKKAKQGA